MRKGDKILCVPVYLDEKYYLLGICTVSNVTETTFDVFSSSGISGFFKDNDYNHSAKWYPVTRGMEYLYKKYE